MRVAAEELKRRASLHILREHHDSKARVFPSQFDRRNEPFIGESRRHPDVGEYNVGSVLFDGATELFGIAHRAGNLDPCIGKHKLDPASE